jgi:hypothetical protein
MKKQMIALSMSLAALIACANRQETEPMTPASGEGMTASNEDAIRQLTTARCQREEACNNIGQGKRYDDQSACQREVAQNSRSMFRTEDCGRVMQSRLNNCIDEVRTQACNNPIDEISRLVT